MDGDGSLFQANEFLWRENARLVGENQQLREELARREDVSLQLGKIEARVQRLAEQNKALRLQLKELTSSRGAVSGLVQPVFKANVRRARSGKSPGRKAGHAAAVRPRPASVDVHQNVPLGVDGFGKPCCPECRAQLSQLQDHERLVEDLILLRTVTTCYHTQSGWCPSCRRRRESRASEQPPASDLAPSQLGINALVMAAILRVNYRMPMRQVTHLYGQLPGLDVCAGTIAQQLQRVGGWVEGHYQQLQQSLRLSKVIHADETGWRTDGANTQLWAITDPKRRQHNRRPTRVCDRSC
jgi:transposase